MSDTFGGMIEVRVGRRSQRLASFVRMLDKDSRWGSDNGLATLIPSLLQMSFSGYPFVLPDMIGGNGYAGDDGLQVRGNVTYLDLHKHWRILVSRVYAVGKKNSFVHRTFFNFQESEPPSEELFVRWLQANAFMPALQFSFVPWRYSRETVAHAREMAQLHADYAGVIAALAEEATETGAPINRPIWWVDPEDEVALAIEDGEEEEEEEKRVFVLVGVCVTAAWSLQLLSLATY